MKYRFLLIPWLLCTLCSCSTARREVSAKNSENPASLAGEEVRPEDVGYVLFDLEQKQIVTSQNLNKAFIPASVQKIATTVMALETLGPRHRFQTKLSYRGQIRKNILHGDLYLKGGGDPFLTAAHLMTLLESLRDRGVHEVQGHFYYDESLLGQSPMINSASAFADESSNPGVGALSAEFGQSFAVVSPNSLGPSGKVYSVPDLSLNKINFVQAPGVGSANFHYQGGAWQLRAAEENLEPAREPLPVKDPGRFTAEFFAKLGAIAGITLPMPEPKTLRGPSQTIATHLSPELLRLVEMNLEFSNNSMSELLLMASAARIAGKPLNPLEASQVLSEWLERKIPQTDWSALRLENGSGLSAKARMTPLQQLAILKYADQRRYGGRSYLSLLPISGWRGTLRRRLAEPQGAFAVWAKTGTLYGSSTLAGYLFSNAGRKYAFVIFVSDLEMRRLYDANSLAKKFSEEELDAKNLWVKNAKHLQDELLMQWILGEGPR